MTKSFLHLNHCFSMEREHSRFRFHASQLKLKFNQMQIWPRLQLTFESSNTETKAWRKKMFCSIESFTSTMTCNVPDREVRCMCQSVPVKVWSFLVRHNEKGVTYVLVSLVKGVWLCRLVLVKVAFAFRILLCLPRQAKGVWSVFLYSPV